jgi:hypothetical protein
MSASVVVGLDYNPGGCVRDTKVEDLALSNQGIETMHDFLNTGSEVPPMNVQQINVIGTKFLQRTVDRDMHGLEGVADKVGLKGLCIASVAAVPSGVFGGNDHLIAVSLLLHPLANPLLGLFALISISSINKVTAEIKKSVKDGKTGILITLAHKVSPIRLLSDECFQRYGCARDHLTIQCQSSWLPDTVENI